MSQLLDLWTVLAVGAGVFFFFAGTVGLLRFPDTLTRLHALTKADNLGLGLVVLGLVLQAGSRKSSIRPKKQLKRKRFLRLRYRIFKRNGIVLPVNR